MGESIELSILKSKLTNAYEKLMALPEKAARLASLNASEQVCKKRKMDLDLDENIFLDNIQIIGIPDGRGKRGQCLRKKHHIPWRERLR